MQNTLFGEIAKTAVKNSVPKEKILWSFSKKGTLDSCPRKYYFQYYGSKKKTAIYEPNKDKLQFLKGLSNEHLIIGEIVHTVIQNHFNKLKVGDPWDLSRSLSFAYKILEDSLQYSVEVSKGIFKTHTYTPAIFLELYYDHIAADSLRIRARKKITVNLENFYQSPNFAHLRSGALTASAIVEGRVMQYFPGITVDGVVDLCYSEDDTWVVADWKTGKNEVEETSLQLLTYAMWLIENKNADIERITLQKAYLDDASIQPLEFSQIHLRRAKAKIIQDAERLKELDEFGNESMIEAFSACGQEKVCHQCSFKEICTKI
jgi:CRISPR/Cas system-associated exonuclease Cas4 (RecB family)